MTIFDQDLPFFCLTNFFLMKFLHICTKHNFFAEFMAKLDEKNIAYSLDGLDRLVRSHGHALHDIIHLRELNFKKQRIPDLITWPQSHEDVIFIVNEAHLRNIVLIPFGGGTSVSWAVSCPEYETRMFVSLDTSQMVNAIKLF